MDESFSCPDPNIICIKLEQTQDIFWYAARAIKRRSYIKETAVKRGIQIYVASQIPSLIFIRCSFKQMEEFFWEMHGILIFYRNLQTHQVRIIPDREMQMFILATSVPGEKVIPLSIQDPEFFQGQIVRVLEGPFKGTEGVIKRIKGDRRLLIQVTGVGAVATSFIPQRFLEAVDTNEKESHKK